MIDRRDFVKGSTAVVAAAAVSGTVATALADAAGYTPGIYTASGAGVGTVTVELTFDEATITEATVDVSGETPWVGGQLGETLAAALLDHQDGTVDVIAGATLTCEGAMTAAAACIAQAKGEEVATPITAWDDQTADNWLGTDWR